MISKKIHTEQLLQLMIALSFLKVDPTNYLDFGNYETLGRGSIQLLQPQITTLSENPYINRKNYIPLIEDLARFDRSYNHNNHVEAYLLNVDEFLNSNSTNNDTETSTLLANNQRNEDVYDHQSSEQDVFLNSEIFDQGESLIEQNYQDLHDWRDSDVDIQSQQISMKIPEVPDIDFDLVVLPVAQDIEPNLLTNSTFDSNVNRTTIDESIINWDELYNSNKNDTTENNFEEKNENSTKTPLNIELTTEVIFFSPKLVISLKNKKTNKHSVDSSEFQAAE
jgi:hypothetical protein